MKLAIFAVYIVALGYSTREHYRQGNLSLWFLFLAMCCALGWLLGDWYADRQKDRLKDSNRRNEDGSR